MAFGIAGLTLEGETTIENADCVEISFPDFWSLLDSLQVH
jgi:3-phosphoshikimate 1-carboxyvinyltransferase